MATTSENHANDPLSVEARKARTFTLGFCVLAFLYAYFNLDITNIQGVGVAVSIERGSSGLIITIGLAYFFSTFLFYAFDDFQHRQSIEYYEIKIRRIRKARDLFGKYIEKRLIPDGRIFSNRDFTERLMQTMASELKDNYPGAINWESLVSQARKVIGEENDRNFVIEKYLEILKNFLLSWEHRILRRTLGLITRFSARFFFTVRFVRAYVLDFLLVPSIALLAFLSIWHTPTREFVRETVPLSAPVQTLPNRYTTITAPR